MKLGSELFPDPPQYDVAAHRDAVQALHRSYTFNNEANCAEHLLEIMAHLFGDDFKIIQREFLRKAQSTINGILRSELIYAPSYEAPAHRTSLEYDEPIFKAGTKAAQVATNYLITIVEMIKNAAGQSIRNGGGFKVPLIQMLADPRQVVARICLLIRSCEYDGIKAFRKLDGQIFENLLTASGHSIKDIFGQKKIEIVYPDQCDLEPVELVEAYLAETPFKEFLLMPVNFSISDEARYEHTHILGPSGSGKTTLIQQIILDDLKRDVPPAMVIIDPKGLMVDRISRLDIFNPEHGRLKDRLVIIDPLVQDTPALSMFTVDGDRRVQNNAIENFRYIFSQARAPLTQKMDPLFTYCVRLLFFMGNANIYTFMDLLSDDPKNSKFADAIARMSQEDEGAKRFFEDYYRSTYAETRQSVKTRLYEVISKPEIMSMLNAATLNVDMWDCLQKGKIVLVNTAMSELTNAAHQLLGRYMISLTLNAAYRRTTVPKDQWNPAFLYIDEFQDFADEEKTPKMLRLAREYNLGITLAHQNMFCTELNEAMRSAISTNTTVKYCSSPEGADQNLMARDLRCDPEFLAAQRKDAENVRFACLVRNTLSSPISVTVPIGGISKEPQMPQDAHAKLLAANTEAVKSRPVERPANPRPAAQPIATTTEAAPSEPVQDEPEGKLW